VDSYTPRRAGRADTVRLWHRIETREDPEWTRRYHAVDPSEKAFGARVEIVLKNGETIVDEMAVANAHPLGARPFGRADYIRKFRILTEGILTAREQNRFIAAAEGLAEIEAGGLGALNVALPTPALVTRAPVGIFDAAPAPAAKATPVRRGAPRRAAGKAKTLARKKARTTKRLVRAPRRRG
jgi:2-methylcitrate dehydratase